MKFSKSARTTFQQDTYNPAPGYYIGSDGKEGFSTTFLKGDRFPDTKHEGYPEYRTVEGFDKLADDKSLRKTVQKSKVLANNYVTQSQIQMRQHQIVHKKTTQNLLDQLQTFLNSQLSITPEGQVIQQKQTGLLQQLQIISSDSPGPGTYDYNVKTIKPRVQNCFIKEPLVPPRAPEVTGSAQPLYGKQIHKPITPTRFISRHREDIDEDNNLEMMLAREKRIPVKKNQNPPPGAYEVASCFGKINELDQHNQCFDSRQPRFKNHHDDLPGPGEYEIKKASTNGGYMSKIPRGGPKIPVTLGAGTYDVKQLTKPQRCDGTFPSSFGSGSKRMLETAVSDTPGPGQYGSGPKRKLPKYVFRNKPKREIEVKVPESFGLAISNEVVQITKKRSTSVTKPLSSVFSSVVQRFPQPDIAEGLGPGAYSTVESFTKGTFNQTGDVLGRAKRIEEQSSQKLGPGSYDCDYGVIRPSKIRDVHF